jgi:hypothetical protein
VIRRATLLALVALLVLAAAAPAAQRLSYPRAKTAVQSKANRFAGTATRITAMDRVGAVTFMGRAKWHRVDPDGCKGCDYDSATDTFTDSPSSESCSVEVVVKLRPSGSLRVSAEEFSCY